MGWYSRHPCRVCTSVLAAVYVECACLGLGGQESILAHAQSRPGPDLGGKDEAMTPSYPGLHCRAPSVVSSPVGDTEKLRQRKK